MAASGAGMRCLGAVTVLTVMAAAATVSAGMSVHGDVQAGVYTILEDGAPVLSYRYRTVPVPPGVEGIYAVPRSDYIHPLYGLAGEVLTHDFAPDHPHHRGIYWAWPEVTYEGVTRDLHALQGVFARPTDRIRWVDGDGSAELVAENLWLWEDRDAIVHETGRIQAWAAQDHMRVIDLTFSYLALQPGVTLARRGQTAYGGLNVRFSARRDQVITKHTGPASFPAAECWAELAGVPPGRDESVGVVFLQHPGNCQYPEDWIDFPPINWLQPAFPAAGTVYALSTETPLTLRYRLVVREGPALDIPLRTLWQEYTEGWVPFSELVEYNPATDGGSRLRTWERRLATCPPGQTVRAERALVAILEDGRASMPLKAWACAQLKPLAGAASVPVLLSLVAEPGLCVQVCQSLETVPDPAVDQGLLSLLPTLNPEQKLVVVRLLGVRGCADAVSVLQTLIIEDGGEPGVRAVALRALGRIATPDALAVLESLRAESPEDPAVADAVLACCSALVKGEDSAMPDSWPMLLESVLATGPGMHRRAAALAVLARVAPADATATATTWLQSERLGEQRGAAAALEQLPPDLVRRELLPLLPELPSTARLVALEQLARAPDPDVVPSVMPLLLQEPCTDVVCRILGASGGAGLVDALAGVAVSDHQGAGSARRALSRLQGDGVDAAVRLLLEHESGAVRRLGAELIAERGGEIVAEEMLRLAWDPDLQVARVALGVLGEQGDASMWAELVPLMPGAEAAHRDVILSALASLARRWGNTDEVVASLAELENAGPALGLQILRQAYLFPGQTALDWAQARLSAADASTREAAGRALLRWPSAVDEPVLDSLRAALQEATTGNEGDEVLPAVLRAALERLILLGARNLCEGRPAESSHPWQGPWGPEKTVDGIVALDSYWSCADSPSSVTVDLGEPAPVSVVRVFNYWDGARFYQYTVEVSADAESWEPVADMSTNTIPATEEGDVHRFEQRSVRFVRVTMLSNSANPGMHIAEIQAFSQLPDAEVNP